MTHQAIIAISEDQDTIILEDGWCCSFFHCCSTVPHPDWNHEDIVPVEEAI